MSSVSNGPARATLKTRTQRLACAAGRRSACAMPSAPSALRVLLGLGGADPEIVRRSRGRDLAPLDHGDRLKHAVQVLAVELGEQLAERDPLLAAVELGRHLEQQPLPGLAVLLDEPFESAEIDRPVGGEAGGGERRDAGRAEDVVDRALRGVERELCSQPAREDVLVALEPRIQAAAAVAELAQLLVCSSRPPPVLLGPIGSLGRIGPRLPPAPRRQRPPPAPKQQLGLALQVRGELASAVPDPRSRLTVSRAPSSSSEPATVRPSAAIASSSSSSRSHSSPFAWSRAPNSRVR